MPRYKLTVAYDGTDFCGWQKQFPHEDAITDAPRMESVADATNRAPAVTPGVTAGEQLETGASRGLSDPTDPLLHSRGAVGAESPARPRVELRTVQSVLERAVRFVVHQPIIIHGASRTDSGVHSRGQVAAFSTIVEEDARGRGGWPIERGLSGLTRAINSRLPHDVLVTGAEVVADDFNPISGAVSKGYSYTLWSGPERTLWERRTSLHIWQPLDIEKMKPVAAELMGEHDFAAFAAAGHGRATTVRTVHGCEVALVPLPVGGARGGLVFAPAAIRGEPLGASTELTPQSPPTGMGSLIRIDVSGSGFLWNMVRIIAGTLVEAGKGRLSVEQVREALKSGDRRKAGPTLPPQGLCLEWIRYAPSAGP